MDRAILGNYLISGDHQGSALQQCQDVGAIVLGFAPVHQEFGAEPTDPLLGKPAEGGGEGRGCPADSALGAEQEDHFARIFSQKSELEFGGGQLFLGSLQFGNIRRKTQQKVCAIQLTAHFLLEEIDGFTAIGPGQSLLAAQAAALLKYLAIQFLQPLGNLCWQKVTVGKADNAARVGRIGAQAGKGCAIGIEIVSLLAFDINRCFDMVEKCVQKFLILSGQGFTSMLVAEVLRLEWQQVALRVFGKQWADGVVKPDPGVIRPFQNACATGFGCGPQPAPVTGLQEWFRSAEQAAEGWIGADDVAVVATNHAHADPGLLQHAVQQLAIGRWQFRDWF